MHNLNPCAAQASSFFDSMHAHDNSLMSFSNGAATNSNIIFKKLYQLDSGTIQFTATHTQLAMGRSDIITVFACCTSCGRDEVGG